MKPTLSIVIPCFNCTNTLRQAVDSCYNQDLGSFEIVLVDDFSTDSTRDVMQALKKEHDDIILGFHDKNLGGGATRNDAIEIASGDIVFCLDSDDLLPDGTLEKMLSYLKEMNCDGVGLNFSTKFKGNNIGDIETLHTFGYAGEKVPFESLFQKNDVFCPLYSVFMFKKEAWKKAGGYPTEHGFDTQGFAWRFLAAGLIAYGCPDTNYLHRVHFTQSYYLREANLGKINYNWRDIFLEHFDLFNTETQEFILAFNCSDFTKNIYEEIKNIKDTLKPDYQKLLGFKLNIKEPIISSRIYIKRNSFKGILLRIKHRLKQNSFIYSFVIHFYGLKNRLKNIFTESTKKKLYYTQIEQIRKNKKIVVELEFGGIGDCLVWSTLPQLLKETYDIDFYLSEKSLTRLRNKDIMRLCFESNPYFKGISKEETHAEVFKLSLFESEKNIFTFITDKGGETVLESLERQFGVKGNGIPKLYYTPTKLDAYKNVILVDENMITGKRFGWKFRINAFKNEAGKKITNPSVDKIEYIDTSNQNLFTYVDMIYSCKYFVGTFSGGASIAACFKKPFSVIWPTNAKNGSNYQFKYSKSCGKYV